MSSESAWPLGERLSVFDRQPTPADELPEVWLLGPILDDYIGRLGMDRLSLRRAVTLGDSSVYLAHDNGDSIFMLRDDGPGHGNSSFASKRFVLAEHGAISSWSWDDRRTLVFGAISDAITAVIVGEHPVAIGDNAFIALLPDQTDDLVVTTVDDRRYTIPGPADSDLHRIANQGGRT